MTVSARHAVEYAALRLTSCELVQLPPAAGLRITEWVGDLAFRLLAGRARVGRANLAQAYPDKSAEEIAALLADVFRNLFRTAGEVLYCRRLVRADNWRDSVEIQNADSALSVYLGGRGGILVGGHLGNWELLGHVLPYIGMRSQVLVRPLDNPLLNDFVLGVRESGLQTIILKEGAGSAVERTLAGGGFVSLLVDQDAGNRGAFVPFFGRLASTWRTPAIMSMKTGAPILPGCCVRLGTSLRFRIMVGEPIYPRVDTDVNNETLRITAEFTRQIEAWVREYPEQYMWLHRRWKSVPGPRSLAAS